MMKSFKIIPILGKKTDVLPDDNIMLKMIDQTTALSHDTGGQNYSLKRQRNACVKSVGLAVKSSAANAQKTLCMGLFELYDGTNRNLFYFDNGLVYKFSSTWTQAEVAVGTPVTFAKTNADHYSIIRVGAYIVWADNGGHEPHKWKHGDANSSVLQASGTKYKFKYLVSFQRRVVGLYSDQTNGNIDIRWSTDWPTTAITSLNTPATNQLWVPNDDPITGGSTLGRDKCFIFCENSIQQLVYYPDHSTPFRCFTVVPDQGATNHHSIVTANGQLYFYNVDLGFCSYGGGNTVVPISDDILDVLRTMNPTYHPLIVGHHRASQKQIVWTMPLDASATPTHVVTYNYDTGQWEIEDKVTRWIDEWTLYTTQTWTTLAAAFGGTGLWSDAGTEARWADYTTTGKYLMYANADGHVYANVTEEISGAELEGSRVEPILYFGNRRRFDSLKEIWFDIGEDGNFNIDIYHRSGDTAGEIRKSGWDQLDSISCGSPDKPMIYVHGKNARMHQIKWSSTGKFVVNGITFKYTEGTEI